MSKPEGAHLKAFGSKVRRRRHQLELTQEQLAEKAELSLRTVQRIEAGELDILITTLDRLCRALECSPNDLLPGPHDS